MDDIEREWQGAFEDLISEAEQTNNSSETSTQRDVSHSDYSDYANLGLSVLGTGIAVTTIFVASAPITIYLAVNGAAVGIASVAVNAVGVSTGLDTTTAKQALGYAEPYGQIGFIAANAVGKTQNEQAWVDTANLVGNLATNGASIVSAQSPQQLARAALEAYTDVASRTDSFEGRDSSSVRESTNVESNNSDPVIPDVFRERVYIWEPNSSKNFENYPIETDEGNNGRSDRSTAEDKIANIPEPLATRTNNAEEK